MEFITKHYAKNKEIFLSTPTWGNHPQICNMIGLKHSKYRYYDAKTISFDLKGAIEDICVSYWTFIIYVWIFIESEFWIILMSYYRRALPQPL